MKQGSIILALVLVLFIGGYYVKQKLNDIEVKFQSIRFLTISRDNIIGEFTIKVTQPFGEVDLSELDLQFYLDGNHISTINQFDAKSKFIGNDIFLTASFSIDPSKVLTLQNALGFLVNFGNNTYTIKGEVRVKKFGISTKILIETTGNFKTN